MTIEMKLRDTATFDINGKEIQPAFCEKNDAK